MEKHGDTNDATIIKPIPLPSKFPLSFFEATVASTVALGFIIGLLGVYLTMPDSDYSFLKLPRTLHDLQLLRGQNLSRKWIEFLNLMWHRQTFMIPGTVFMSLLAGALFGVFKGVALVVFTATAGASSCFFLSKLIGRPLLFSLWPDKLKFFQTQVAKRRKSLLNYMLFLRLTPTLPNTFINFASPIVDVPYHIFFLGTVIGLIPAAYVTVRAGLALGELQSVGDLYDFNSIATSIPTTVCVQIFRKKRLQHGSPLMVSLPSAAVVQDNHIIDAGGKKRRSKESVYALCSYAVMN
ncbi:hypothetical protein TSUD_408010 [Trifolium subterraneum]|uniref:VTT domain-containing protein n=1 Tax=Trifolium subterraneum TaxID=3900 RepID=A0A2Z6PRA5_TRISU|nr:hypothetical protein TSUD_408010 [Trifolium subterraneum]